MEYMDVFTGMFHNFISIRDMGEENLKYIIEINENDITDGERNNMGIDLDSNTKLAKQAKMYRNIRNIIRR